MTKKVVTRTRRARRPAQTEFSFSADDLSAVQNGGTEFGNAYRQQAWDTFLRLPMPTTSDEPWRRTDLRQLDAGSFLRPAPGAFENLPPIREDLLVPLVGDRQAGQILLRPGGGLALELDPDLSRQGVVFTDLQTAEQDHGERLQEVMGRIVGSDEGKFAALTAALQENGIFLYIPPGLQVDKPFHSVLWNPGEHLAHFFHLLVYIDKGASATYVHETASPENHGSQSLHGSIVEVHVGDQANLTFVELQSLDLSAWYFTHERARVGRDSNLDWIYGAIGTQLTKSFIDLDIEGEGASARMSGFFFTNGKQHIDLDTQQNHLVPNTTSDLLYKGALQGKSRAVWQGMIYVAPGAQKTDGYQANRNLVLNSAARADSIPGLEILADDVRCTHGATVGKIDPELLFYLRTRGVPEEEAKRLIVEGFFEPIMDRIPFEGVQARFRDEIQRKMGAAG